MFLSQLSESVKKHPKEYDYIITLKMYSIQGDEAKLVHKSILSEVKDEALKPPDSLVAQNNDVVYYFQIRKSSSVKVDLIQLDLLTMKMKVVKEFDHFKKQPYYIAFCHQEFQNKS